MVQIVIPEPRYIRSFWRAVDSVARERIYLASTRAAPFKSTVEFVTDCTRKNIPQLFLVERETGRCVGWCDATPKNESTGYIGMGIIKEHRGRGFGTKLLQELIPRCKAYGYQKLQLDVRKSNARAIRLYEKIGFSMSGIIKGGFEYRGYIVDEDILQMELSL